MGDSPLMSLFMLMLLLTWIFLNLFIDLFLVALGLCCSPWAFFSCGEQGLLFVALHCSAQVSLCSGFSYCGAQALDAQASVVAAFGLSNFSKWARSCGAQASVALRHVESSETRYRTSIPCIGKQILVHFPQRNPFVPWSQILKPTL